MAEHDRSARVIESSLDPLDPGAQSLDRGHGATMRVERSGAARQVMDGPGHGPFAGSGFALDETGERKRRAEIGDLHDLLPRRTGTNQPSGEGVIVGDRTRRQRTFRRLGLRQLDHGPDQLTLFEGRLIVGEEPCPVPRSELYGFVPPPYGGGRPLPERDDVNIAEDSSRRCRGDNHVFAKGQNRLASAAVGHEKAFEQGALVADDRA